MTRSFCFRSDVIRRRDRVTCCRFVTLFPVYKTSALNEFRNTTKTRGHGRTQVSKIQRAKKYVWGRGSGRKISAYVHVQTSDHNSFKTVWNSRVSSQPGLQHRSACVVSPALFFFSQPLFLSLLISLPSASRSFCSFLLSLSVCILFLYLSLSPADVL